MKILIVEDNPTDLKLSEQVLSEAGHQIISAELAEQSFAKIKRTKPDLILMDLNLPGMTGLKLAKMLRDDKETMDVPIIAISAYVERFSRAAVTAAGCDGYLAKPLNTRTLAHQLEAIALKKPRTA